MPRLAINDRAMLQAMVFMEIELPKIQKKIAKMKDGREIKAANEAYTNMLKEYRLLQDALKISRNQRSDDIDMQQEVDKLIAESNELVEKYGTEITCIFCESKLEMGYVIFHFRDDTPWQMSFDCPKCGKLNTIHGIKETPARMLMIESPNVQ